MEIQINDAASIPAVGFGTYLINDAQAEISVTEALQVGYRHIDTAEGYQNEAGVGRALRASGLGRDEVFITTKMWPGNPAWGQPIKDYSATIAALDSSLDSLGLDYVDLYLIHAPFAGAQRLEQWQALEELRRQGKARSIGVSNFSSAHLDEIQTAGLYTPDVNQIELHPWSQKPELTSYMQQRGIVAVAYSSLVPLAEWRVAEGHDSSKSEEMTQAGTREDFSFKKLAAKYQVTEAQFLLRWGLQKGYAVLPKSTNPARIRQNIDLFYFEIAEDDMAAVAVMDQGPGVAWTSGDPVFQQ
jgi:2,5-diketo-D-gluconate reductase A